jgi:hypothetical protein
MKTRTGQDTAAAMATPKAASARRQTSHRFLLIADMLEDTASAFPEAWRSYGNVAEARRAAEAMMRSRRVLRVAIVEDRIPMQFVEWIDREPSIAGT